MPLLKTVHSCEVLQANSVVKIRFLSYLEKVLLKITFVVKLICDGQIHIIHVEYVQST